MVKLFASEEVFKVAQHAVELHGGNGIMLDFGIEKLFRDAAVFLHMDATVDIRKFKIVKLMFPHTAGAYAGPRPESRYREASWIYGEHVSWHIGMALLARCAPGFRADPTRARTIRIIVPFTPGSVTDIIGAQRKRQAHGEPRTAVIVENRPGAGGTLGTAGPSPSPRPRRRIRSQWSPPGTQSIRHLRQVPYDSLQRFSG